MGVYGIEKGHIVCEWYCTCVIVIQGLEKEKGVGRLG